MTVGLLKNTAAGKVPSQSYFRLSDIRVGQVWLVDHPRRVCYVVSKQPTEVPDSITGTAISQDAFIVRSSVAHKVIPGFVGEEEANAASLNLEAILRSERGKGLQENEWTELWGEQLCYPLKRDKRSGAVMVDETVPERRLARLVALDEDGRSPMRMKSSSVINRPITGKIIPSHLVPAGLFKELDDARTHSRKETDGQATPPVEARQGENGVGGQGDGGGEAVDGDAPLPQTVAGLTVYCRKRGIDISDINGQGSRHRILERIQEWQASQPPVTPCP